MIICYMNPFDMDQRVQVFKGPEQVAEIHEQNFFNLDTVITQLCYKYNEFHVIVCGNKQYGKVIKEKILKFNKTFYSVKGVEKKSIEVELR